LSSEFHEESIFIDHGDHKLHLKRFYNNSKAKPCFLLHGSIENGKIFYSKSGKGLAPYLAQNGYDVFVPDLRGRGKSAPKVSKDSKHDQHDAITQEIPTFIEKIREIKDTQALHMMAHSWGGVLLLSYLARFKNTSIKSMVFFGTKRKIDVINLDRIWRIDLLWDHAGGILNWIYGYLPAKEYKFGSDNEPSNFYKQVKKWAIRGNWVDQIDGYDYGKNILKNDLPPTLYLTGLKDSHMGHRDDVKRLMKEVGSRDSDQFKLLSQNKGSNFDYGHIDILTSPHAINDHFLTVLQWLKKHD